MEFRSVDTEAAALDQLSVLGGDARILAGGTDLVLQHSRGEVHPKVLLHVGRLPGLRLITLDVADLVIGALATHTDLQRNQLVGTRFPALVQAAATIGGWQTQVVGTIGGNVCNASPAADTLPPLLVADATVELSSLRGSRTMPLDDFVVGRRQVRRDPDELATGLRLPLPPERTGEVYLKVAPRTAMEVALVGLAVRLTIDQSGVVRDARIAVCAAGPRPFRGRLAETRLTGSMGDDATIREAGALLAEEARPIDDARATARYRRMVLPRLLGRAVAICTRRAVLQ
jgi:carbon-monoxide dehydrogenase medium subunit